MPDSFESPPLQRYLVHRTTDYAEPIDLEELVEHANVSERTLLEGFKRYRQLPCRLRVCLPSETPCLN